MSKSPNAQKACDKRPKKELMSTCLSEMLKADKDWLWRSIQRHGLFENDDRSFAKILVNKILKTREGVWLKSNNC